jgi:predicted dehydrogenase
MLSEELEEFSRCVRGEASPETGASQGLAALGVVLAAIRSHEAGRAVPVEEVLAVRAKEGG